MAAYAIDGPMTDSDLARRQRLMGIALMCCAGLSLTGIDVTAKFLNHHMDSLEVVWARYTSAFLLALTVSNPLTRPGLIVTKRPLLQLTRSLLMVGGTLLNVVALRYLQIDQTYSINFTTPMLVAAFAGPLLGEWIGWRRWVAIIVGFAGVLLVIRPGFGGIQSAALFSVGAATCYAFYGITTRRLSHSDSNETQLFYGNLVGAAVTSAVVWLVWTTPHSLLIMALMLATGAFGSLGHFLLIAAYRLAPASLITPFMYMQLIWGITFGYLVFDQLPNHWTIAGAGIVIASGLYIFSRERKAHAEDTIEATQAVSDSH